MFGYWILLRADKLLFVCGDQYNKDSKRGTNSFPWSTDFSKHGLTVPLVKLMATKWYHLNKNVEKYLILTIFWRFPIWVESGSTLINRSKDFRLSGDHDNVTPFKFKSVHTFEMRIIYLLTFSFMIVDMGIL